MSLPLKKGRVVAVRDRVGIAPPDDPTRQAALADLPLAGGGIQ